MKSQPRRVGGKLVDWLSEALGGSWIMSGGRLITDAATNPVRLMMALDSARAEQHKAFAHLDGLEEDFHWQPTPEEIADYVVRGPLAQRRANDSGGALKNRLYHPKIACPA